jgi:CxxC-x17-CxxC domain-containing protein
MIDGVASSPFSAVTLPLHEKPPKSYKETIIRVSRERYGTPRQLIEEKIEKWAGTQIQIPPPQKQILYDAQCSSCGKKIKVPFLPDPSKPVYCSSCLKKTTKEETVSLTSLKPREEKPKERKKVDVESIKKVLEEILKKNEKNK